jgi:tricorn protease
MKNYFFALCTLLPFTLSAVKTPLWIRNGAISPDGISIVFCYKGDLFTVPVEGGQADQITSHPGYDTRPVWSPDGKKIAFASNRAGGFDVYIVNKEGGTPKRLTTHSAHEYPDVFKDDTHILYQSSILPDAMDGQFPSGSFPQVYEVSTEGGRSSLFSSLTMEEISINQNGDLLYQDKKGYEDTFRKHHQSPITRDIWLTKVNGERSYKKLTSFYGEDRNPVWAPDGNSFFYLSEENGSFNVFKSDVKSMKPKQLTSFNDHPVRYLSVAGNETLCFSYDGELYTQKGNEQAKKVKIEIVTDNLEKEVEYQFLSGGVSDMAVSSNNKEVAFIVHGDVYVTSVDYQTTKRITNTAEQERDVDFSPDGRTLIYSSERKGIWGIYKTELVRESDKQFVYAHELKEEPLIVNKEAASFQAKYAPNGEEIAFLQNRTELKVYNIKSKAIRTALDGKFNYSYRDGDMSFEWSPDSKWILTDYIGIGGWNNKDIALVKADGSGEVVNLTESGYSDGGAHWALDGKAVIFKGDYAGYRSHGSWGAHTDMYIMFFDAKAFEKFQMNKEDLALLEEAEKAEKEKKDAKEKEKEKDKDKEKEKGKDKGKDKKEDVKKEEKKNVEELVFDFENRKDRILRLTINSSNLQDGILTKDGKKLYYLTSFEGGVDLWERNFQDNSTRIVNKGLGGGSIVPDKELKNFYLVNGSIKKIDMSSASATQISFSAPFDYKAAGERNYIFSHAWQQVKDKFYVADLHGIDWEGYKTDYEKFLPHINNNYDFAEMLSEMLGELNGSHTGARYSGPSAQLSTASLGAFYDDSFDGDGLKIKEIIKRGPLTTADSKIKVGSVIQKIDGREIKKGEDYFPLLEGKAGKKVVLTVMDPKSKETFEEVVKPIAGTSRLLYKRWVEQRKAMTDKLSNGRIGYVHVEGMNSESFREVYSEILGLYRNKEAVIVDTRHNGGGWLHNDLAILLSGKEFEQFVPRGQYIGSDPYTRWYKPSAVLVCEDNYSNAHGFPFMYKELGIGKLIGTPVAGTMTAVWWETQIDPSLVFGIPEVAVKDMKGNYLENQILKPDIEVFNDPASQLKGEDLQLETAVESLLKDLRK